MIGGVGVVGIRRVHMIKILAVLGVRMRLEVVPAPLSSCPSPPTVRMGIYYQGRIRRANSGWKKGPAQIHVLVVVFEFCEV